MDKVKQWVAVAVLAALVVLAGGWFLVVAPTRGEAAELREQTALQEGTNTSLETSLEVLRTKAEALEEKKGELLEVGRRIPPGPALPELLRALEGAATSAGVELTSITPSPPVAVDAAVPAVPAPAPAADGTTPAPAAPAAPAATGLSSIEVKVSVIGDFYAVEHFLALLEELPRALRVTALSLAPGADALDESTAGGDRAVRASITGLVYLSSPAQAAAPAGSATAPAGGAVPGAASASSSAPAS